MLRIRGYFLPGVKPTGFMIHVSIFLPSKLGYQKSSGVTSWRFARSESFTCVSWVSRFVCASSVYASARCVGSPIEDEAAAVGRGGIGEDGVIPGGDRLSRAALRVEPHEVRAAVLGRGDDHRLAVRRPDRGARAAAAARRRLVADHVSAHVEVVVGREIPSSTVP